LSVRAVLGNDFFGIAEFTKVIDVMRSDKVDVAAVSSIPAVRSAFWQSGRFRRNVLAPWPPLPARMTSFTVSISMPVLYQLPRSNGAC